MNKIHERIVIALLGALAIILVIYMMNKQQQQSEWVRKKQTFINDSKD